MIKNILRVSGLVALFAFVAQGCGNAARELGGLGNAGDAGRAEGGGAAGRPNAGSGNVTAAGGTGSDAGAASADAGAPGEAGAPPVADCNPGQTETCWETATGEPIGPQKPAIAQGNCRFGERTCDSSGSWGVCQGAVGPKAADDCAVSGDDADCNGKLNENCACVNGQERVCGKSVGICKEGKQTCADQKWSDCVGEVKPKPADDCAVAGDDSDCNGKANENCPCVGSVSEACGDCGTRTCAPASKSWGACMPAQPSKLCGTCGTQLCGSSGKYGACIPSEATCLSPTQLRSCTGGTAAAPDFVTTTCMYLCASSKCDGECVPGTTRCSTSPERREECSAVGKWTLAETCTTGALCQGAGVSCKKPNGMTCTAATDCVSGVCSTFYLDSDADTFGTSSVTSKVCGSTVPAGYVTNATDCCDTDPNARPTQTVYFATANACGSYDYNCSGNGDPDPTQPLTVQNCNLTAMTCSRPPGFGALPACGAFGGWVSSCFYMGVGNGGGTCVNATPSSVKLRCR